MLRTRVITALVLVAVFALALFSFSRLAWTLFAAVVAALAGWEWGGLCRWAQPLRLAYGGALAAMVVAVAYWCGLDTASPDGVRLTLAFGLSAAFWLLAGPAWLARRWPLGGGPAAAACGALVLVPTALALIYLRALGPWWLLAAMAVVWVADIAAYFSGRAFGRRKLAPAISPGKSWEGVYGAAVAVAIYGAVVLLAAAPALGALQWLGALAGLLVLTGISVAGDLFESMLKRQAGIKDSSALLPGHGGVLDRIDSLTSTLPLVALAAVVLA